jgi:hypothetical protein
LTFSIFSYGNCQCWTDTGLLPSQSFSSTEIRWKHTSISQFISAHISIEPSPCWWSFIESHMDHIPHKMIVLSLSPRALSLQDIELTLEVVSLATVVLICETICPYVAVLR